MKSNISANCKALYTGLIVTVFSCVLLADSAVHSSGVSDITSSGKAVSANTRENAQAAERDGFVLYFTNVFRVAREGEWSTVAMAIWKGLPEIRRLERRYDVKIERRLIRSFQDRSGANLAKGLAYMTMFIINEDLDLAAKDVQASPEATKERLARASNRYRRILGPVVSQQAPESHEEILGLFSKALALRSDAGNKDREDLARIVPAILESLHRNTSTFFETEE